MNKPPIKQLTAEQQHQLPHSVELGLSQIVNSANPAEGVRIIRDAVDQQLDDLQAITDATISMARKYQQLSDERDALQDMVVNAPVAGGSVTDDEHISLLLDRDRLKAENKLCNTALKITQQKLDRSQTLNGLGITGLIVTGLAAAYLGAATLLKWWPFENTTPAPITQVQETTNNNIVADTPPRPFHQDRYHRFSVERISETEYRLTCPDNRLLNHSNDQVYVFQPTLDESGDHVFSAEQNFNYFMTFLDQAQENDREHERLTAVNGSGETVLRRSWRADDLEDTLYQMHRASGSSVTSATEDTPALHQLTREGIQAVYDRLGENGGLNTALGRE